MALKTLFIGFFSLKGKNGGTCSNTRNVTLQSCITYTWNQITSYIFQSHVLGTVQYTTVYIQRRSMPRRSHLFARAIKLS